MKYMLCMLSYTTYSTTLVLSTQCLRPQPSTPCSACIHVVASPVVCGRVYSSLHLLHHSTYDIQTNALAQYPAGSVMMQYALPLTTCMHYSTTTTAGGVYCINVYAVHTYSSVQPHASVLVHVDVQQVSSSLGVSTWSRYLLLLSHPLDVQTTVLIPLYYMQHTCSTYTTFTTYTTTLHVVYMCGVRVVQV